MAVLYGRISEIPCTAVRSGREAGKMSLWGRPRRSANVQAGKRASSRRRSGAFAFASPRVLPHRLRRLRPGMGRRFCAQAAMLEGRGCAETVSRRPSCEKQFDRHGGAACLRRRLVLCPASVTPLSATLLACGKGRFCAPRASCRCRRRCLPAARALRKARPGSCAERFGVGASFCMQVTVDRTRGTARSGCAPSPPGFSPPPAGLRRALPAPAQGPSALENPLRCRAYLAAPHPRPLRASPPVGGATAGPARTRSRAVGP